MNWHKCWKVQCPICDAIARNNPFNQAAGSGDLNVPMVVIGLDFGREPTAYEHHAFTNVEPALDLTDCYLFKNPS